MSGEQLVIVGGGPAGLSAARGYRAAGGTGTVTLLAAERHLPYRRPPLTKEFLRGELDAGELPLERPEWFERNEIRLELDARVRALDLDRRTLSVEHLGEVEFDRCVLATGARPARPAIDGADAAALHLLRTRESSAALAQAVDPGTHALVVGSGFIGSEAAASLALRGARVTLVTDEPTPHAARLGQQVGERIAAWLEELGVTLRGGAAVAAFEPAASSTPFVVLLEDGQRLEADAVVLALGIEPAVELARAAGLELEHDRIACGPNGATSAEGIFAAGDVARLYNRTAGRALSVEHWGEALAQGEVAGRAVAGEDACWDAVPGFWSTIGERTLKQAAWGDGHDELRLVDHPGGGWSAWLGRDGICVGVLAHEGDEDYERGRELVAAGARLP